MTQPTDKVREAFEAWLRLRAAVHQYYSEYERAVLWESWQAATKLARTAALNEAILLFDAQGLHLLMSPPPQQALKDLRDGK